MKLTRIVSLSILLVTGLALFNSSCRKKKDEPVSKICASKTLYNKGDTIKLENCSDNYTKQRWRFPDGTQSTDKVIYYVPATVGFYKFTLYVSNSDYVYDYESYTYVEVKQVVILHVRLNQIELFGYHGLYPEERILGNRFILSIDIALRKTEIQTLNDSIDYTQVLDIIRTRFNKPSLLLETLLLEIEKDLLQHFAPKMAKLFIKLEKCNPPLSGRVFSSEVILEKDYI